jgi:hypothetical protein
MAVALAAPTGPVEQGRPGRARRRARRAAGGNLFGRLALHPSVTEISDQAERGTVVNGAWRRYGAVNTVSLVAVASGWIGARLRESADGRALR